MGGLSRRFFKKVQETASAQARGGGVGIEIDIFGIILIHLNDDMAESIIVAKEEIGVGELGDLCNDANEIGGDGKRAQSGALCRMKDHFFKRVRNGRLVLSVLKEHGTIQRGGSKKLLGGASRKMHPIANARFLNVILGLSRTVKNKSTRGERFGAILQNDLQRAAFHVNELVIHPSAAAHGSHISIHVDATGIDRDRRIRAQIVSVEHVSVVNGNFRSFGFVRHGQVSFRRFFNNIIPRTRTLVNSKIIHAIGNISHCVLFFKML